MNKNLIILQIIKKIELLHKKNDKVVIKWMFEEEDEDMEESGEEYALCSSVPFEIIERPER